MAGSIEQADAEPFLQLPQLLADGTGCHAHHFGGRCQAAVAAGFNEGPQGQQGQYRTHLPFSRDDAGEPSARSPASAKHSISAGSMAVAPVRAVLSWAQLQRQQTSFPTCMPGS
ncbi:hypothetical protein D3C72_1288010 [compost metagenome]